MRSLLRMLVLAWILSCTPALADEAVNVAGRAMGVLQYPTTNTICLRFETKEGQRFLVCDDVTAKDIIEQLFSFGKKDAPCRIEGTVAKKSGEDVYLRVTRVVAQGN